jgi:LDH2 family malate/lactate/ureidoglycolate dehydrogenase
MAGDDDGTQLVNIADLRHTLILLAAERGDPLSEGARFDRAGPSANPQALVDGGSMTPPGTLLAPYKGFGLALDVEAFLPGDEFRARMDALIDQVEHAQAVAGGAELTASGERRERRLEEQVARGTVPLTRVSSQILATCCESLGVAPPERLAAREPGEREWPC